MRELRAAGWEIGAHTRTHPDLRRVPQAVATDEIIGSKKDIEERLGESVATFAYPYGGVSGEAAALVSQEFAAACTTRLSRAYDEPAHLLPRIDMYYFATTRDLIRLAQGRMDSYLALRRCGREIRGLWEEIRPHRWRRARRRAVGETL